MQVALFRSHMESTTANWCTASSQNANHYQYWLMNKDIKDLQKLFYGRVLNIHLRGQSVALHFVLYRDVRLDFWWSNLWRETWTHKQPLEGWVLKRKLHSWHHSCLPSPWECWFPVPPTGGTHWSWWFFAAPQSLSLSLTHTHCGASGPGSGARAAPGCSLPPPSGAGPGLVCLRLPRRRLHDVRRHLCSGRGLFSQSPRIVAAQQPALCPRQAHNLSVCSVCTQIVFWSASRN